MRIYKMTATFGALEHRTLTLEPGLNIIEAPNEWGKSTWCAFLVNMLYGLDTRARSTKDALADKDRYAPWSGLPMSGRIDLNWNGKDITIERRTKGRLTFGEFSAYETDTGLEIPELTGSNCGQMLLGVERSVFTRSGFLKLTDLPVTQDEALRRRLNALVTTGDESGAGDKLQHALKDLKNKCRYNKSGLLPQAENEREQLEGQLHELSLLNQQCQQLSARQSELTRTISDLENHKVHLLYADCQENIKKVKLAEAACRDAQTVAEDTAAHCEGLPSAEEAAAAAEKGKSLQQQWLALQQENASLPPLPQAVAAPECYQGLTGEQAVAQAEKDAQNLQSLHCGHKKKNNLTLAFSLAGGICLIAAAVLYFAAHLLTPVAFYAIGGAGLFALMIGLVIRGLTGKTYRQAVQQLSLQHPGVQPESWVSHAQAYAQQLRQYEAAYRDITTQRGDLDEKIRQLNEEIASYAKGSSLEEALAQWQQISQAHVAAEKAAHEHIQAQSLLNTLRSMVTVAEKPAKPDILAESHQETDYKLQSARMELHQLQQRLGQAEGRCEALGQEGVLRSQLKAVNLRISRLEDTYHALELAQTALSNATSELQRRFAPRISKRAQELFHRLTNGRYDRFALSEDLSIKASAETEDTLHSAEERSDGTADQLYLALRLAVSQELTPNAPMILDDALVRFDDRRLKAALEILQEVSTNKQVILFTCQGREKTIQGEMK